MEFSGRNCAERSQLSLRRGWSLLTLSFAWRIYKRSPSVYFSLTRQRHSVLGWIMRAIALTDLQKHFFGVSKCRSLMPCKCNLSVCLCCWFCSTLLCPIGAEMLCQCIMTMSLAITGRVGIFGVIS